METLADSRFLTCPLLTLKYQSGKYDITLEIFQILKKLHVRYKFSIQVSTSGWIVNSNTKQSFTQWP